MTKTILVPIDFTVRSLNTLKLALSSSSNCSHRVILLYGELPSDSITEMLFFRRSKVLSKKKTNEFMEALQIIKNRYESKIHSIVFDMITVNNKATLNEYLEDQFVDHIFIPSNYRLKLKGNAFDTISLLINSDIPVSQVAFEHSNSVISDMIYQYQAAFS